MILKFEKPLSSEEKQVVAEHIKHFYPDHYSDQSLSDFMKSYEKDIVIPNSSHELCDILLENLRCANINAFIVREKRHDDGILMLTSKAVIQHDLRITLKEYNWLSEQRGKYSKKYDHAKKDLGINHTTLMITEHGVIFSSIIEKSVDGKIDIQRIEELMTVHYNFLDAMNEVRLSEEKKSEDEEDEEIDISDVVKESKTLTEDDIAREIANTIAEAIIEEFKKNKITLGKYETDETNTKSGPSSSERRYRQTRK